MLQVVEGCGRKRRTVVYLFTGSWNLEGVAYGKVQPKQWVLYLVLAVKNVFCDFPNTVCNSFVVFILLCIISQAKSSSFWITSKFCIDTLWLRQPKQHLLNSLLYFLFSILHKRNIPIYAFHNDHKTNHHYINI